LRLGLFMMPLHPVEKDVAQCYDEDFELLVHDWDDKTRRLRSLELLVREVIPALADL